MAKTEGRLVDQTMNWPTVQFKTPFNALPPHNDWLSGVGVGVVAVVDLAVAARYALCNEATVGCTYHTVEMQNSHARQIACEVL